MIPDLKVGISSLNIDGDGGINNYAKRLYTGLDELGVCTKSVWSGFSGNPFSKFKHSLINQPISVARNANDFDIVHATEPAMGVVHPIIQTPNVVTYHDLIPLENPELIRKESTIKNKLYKKANTLAFSTWHQFAKRSDHAIAVSNQTKDTLLEHGWEEENVTVIPEPVDERFRPLDVKTTERNVVGYFGSLSYRKRPHLAIELLSKLDESWELWLCGSYNDPNYYNYLIEKSEDLGVMDRVVIKGWIPDDELIKTINKFDVMFYPSSYEGFGFPIVEVSQCGVPVVILSDGRIPEETGKYGINAEDVKEAADIIQSKPERVDFFDPPISVRGQAKRTVSVYQDVLDSKN